MAEESPNKRVAKNAIVLTLRMALVTVVGLFTSRIVLEALGVGDYGIYGVVGGVVGMASFLNTSMAGATSRFITFELGKGNTAKLKNIFSTALIIHFIIAIIVVALAETVGLWFLNHKMVIPEDRMFAANVLYQFSVVSVIVGFTQVPYVADIIAHEKMNIYAYFEIVNVVLKLAIVYLLLIVDTDRLILYGGLTFSVSIISAMFYRWYCIRKFPEARFSTHFNRQTAKEMLKFSGFDLYGNLCVVAKTQGQPIVLNLFYGVVANAATSIALTVAGAVSGLTTTVAQAFRPQIIKLYAKDDIQGMAEIMRQSVVFTLLAFSSIAITVIVEAPGILYLWLGQIPEYSVEFLRLILVASMFNIIVNCNNIAIHSTGNIKYISFISGTLYLFCPVGSYCIMKMFEGVAQTVYCVDIAMMSLVSLLGLFFIHKQIAAFPMKLYLLGILKCIMAVGVTLILVYTIKSKYFAYPHSHTAIESIGFTSVVFFSSILVLAIISLVLVLNKSERHWIYLKIHSKKG